MAIHIGQIIKKALQAKDISAIDFAKSINYTRSNAYKIFEKETLDTALLIRINEVLGENLFFYYIKESELDEKCDEKLKSKIALKAWDDFMSNVKADEQKAKAKKSIPNKAKPSKKAKK